MSTIRAPLRDIARFAAYHLDLGAAEVHIFLDTPDDTVAAFFGAVPGVHITQCDAQYWQGVPDRRRATHQRRQAHNATRGYRRARVDWLAHIDVDEFLVMDRPVAQVLRDQPAGVSHVRLRPAELLAQPDPFCGPAHFKLPRPDAGVGKAALVEIYGDLGAYLAEGFLGYSGGKNIARTGLKDLQFGIHAVKQGGAPLATGVDLSGAYIGHAHAPSFDVFQAHLAFRLTKGSYRRRGNEAMRVEDIVKIVQDDSGEVGVRRFYDQVNAATPGLLDRLDRHGMLLTHALDLDDKVAHWFGPLPEDT